MLLTTRDLAKGEKWRRSFSTNNHAKSILNEWAGKKSEEGEQNEGNLCDGFLVVLYCTII